MKPNGVRIHVLKTTLLIATITHQITRLRRFSSAATNMAPTTLQPNTIGVTQIVVFEIYLVHKLRVNRVDACAGVPYLNRYLDL